MWSKDRAVGEEVRSPYGMEEEAEAEQEVANLENGDDKVEGTATTNASNMSSTSRKRKRPNNTAMFTKVLRETIGSLDQTIVTAIESLGDKISNHA